MTFVPPSQSDINVATSNLYNSGGNWLQFARAVLFALGVPDTPDNEAAFLTWFLREQPPDSPNGAFNPLNIQAGDYPHVSTTGSGQYNFGNWQQGVTVTADFLRQGAYSGIVSALQQGNNAVAVLTAVQDSPWASGHYGGTLPDSLSYVLANWAAVANGIIGGAVPGGETGTSPNISLTGASLPEQIVSSALDPLGIFSGGAVGNISDLVKAVVNVSVLSVKALKFLVDPHSWVRIGMVLGGVAIIVVAYSIVNRDTIQEGISAAGKAAVLG